MEENFQVRIDRYIVSPPVKQSFENSVIYIHQQNLMSLIPLKLRMVYDIYNHT